jgi:hypothetical protein
MATHAREAQYQRSCLTTTRLPSHHESKAEWHGPSPKVCLREIETNSLIPLPFHSEITES